MQHDSHSMALSNRIYFRSCSAAGKCCTGHVAIWMAVSPLQCAEQSAHFQSRLARILPLGLLRPAVPEVSLNGFLLGQAAEILLMTRTDGEPASDFQEYTLVALVAVAAHLEGCAAEQVQLPALAARFGQEPGALEKARSHSARSRV